MRAILTWLALWAVAMLCVGCGKREEIAISGEAMGTTWTLRCVGDVPVERIANRLAELETIFSTWDENSVVSQLNRGMAVDLPPE